MTTEEDLRTSPGNGRYGQPREGDYTLPQALGTPASSPPLSQVSAGTPSFRPHSRDPQWDMEAWALLSSSAHWVSFALVSGRGNGKGS